MKLKICRNCQSTKYDKLFSLGNLSTSGFFPKKKNIKVKKQNITLIKCKKCHLVQLLENFKPSELYNLNYGYRTGINKTMTNHVKSIVKKATRLSKLKKNELVLDIASNDGTLLNFYPSNVIKCGCDPIAKKFKKNYRKIDYKISNFFSYKNIINFFNKDVKFKIITAIAVFYDLEKPNDFLKDVHKLLHQDGVFVLEFADLYHIIKNNMFDTICHEHIEYYSSKVLISMAAQNNLRVFDIEKNNANGGSVRFYLCKQNSLYNSLNNKVHKILEKEKKIGLEKIYTYKKFFKKIQRIKSQLVSKLIKLKLKKYKIFGYGASTKGNILIEYFGIGKNYLDFISDRNPEKNGKYTPGDKIPIISENYAKKLNPDYYLVLPWHFKREILQREKKQIKKGTKFIFPLPDIKVY